MALRNQSILYPSNVEYLHKGHHNFELLPVFPNLFQDQSMHFSILRKDLSQMQYHYFVFLSPYEVFQQVYLYCFFSSHLCQQTYLHIFGTVHRPGIPVLLLYKDRNSHPYELRQYRNFLLLQQYCQ